MAASSSTQKRSPSPCGCGGSSSPKVSSYGCGGNCKCGAASGGTCATCQDDGYSRPKFFAGQLLTEGDLQQLSDYVVAKNRLHARHLFGSGVACGLEVSCYPCGGGKVMVDPGYALDCCGNDIVISCPQDLDIIQMIRDLRRQQHGGVDCGDPCPKATATPASPSVSAANIAGRTGTTTEVPTPECHKYCLYVNYCEQPSDPVSPYVTGDPCGAQTCETTRIREGFRFELRCPDCAEPEPAICTRLNCGLGDADSREGYRKIAEQLQKRGSEIEAAFRSMHASQHKGLSKGFEKLLRSHTGALKPLLQPLKKEKTHSLSEAHALVDATLALASDVALWAIQTPEAQIPFLKQITDSALPLLKQAPEKLTSVQGMFPTAMEQAYAASLSSTTELLLTKTAPLVSPAAVRAAAASPPVVHDDLIRLLAYGVSSGTKIQNQMVSDTEYLRAQVLFSLQQEAVKTRCDLFDTVSAAPKLQAVTSEISLPVVSLAGSTSRILGRAFIDLERACFCNALNPPCLSCDDPGVLLACITVEDCKVKDICNLDRQFVLSPVALRYWIPEITRAGHAIAKACCPCPCPDKPHPFVEDEQTASAYSSGPDYAALIFRLLKASCPDKAPARYALEGLDEYVTARMAAKPVMEASDFAAELHDTHQQLDKLRAEHESLAEELRGLLDREKGNP